MVVFDIHGVSAWRDICGSYLNCCDLLPGQYSRDRDAELSVSLVAAASGNDYRV